MTQQTQLTSARAILLRTCHLCCGLVVDLLQGSCQLVTDSLWGYYCNGL